MSFYHKGNRADKPKSIDTNAIVMQAGKPINWKKFTQENNVDLDIYEVRKKYDGEYRNRLKYDPEIEAAEIDHTMTLEKVYERNKAIKNQWLNLPEEVRKEFNNDVNEFTDRGQAWLNEKRKKAEEEKKKLANKIIQGKVSEEEAKNIKEKINA